MKALSVSATLGGGYLGYSALVLTLAAYNTIPSSLPFVRQVNPGDFTVTVSRVLRGDLSAILTVQDIAE